MKDAKSRMQTLTEHKNQMTRDLMNAQKKCQMLEQSKEEQELLHKGLKSQYEMRINRLEKEITEQVAEKAEVIQRLQRENESLASRIQQVHRGLGATPQQSVKPTTSTMEKNPSDASSRTANVKPMAGPSQQSATVQPWRGSSSSGDTPLASIRPISVQNNRTAAVLPTNVQAVQGSAPGTSGQTQNVTALVPPQQQVHTTGSQPGEAMSSSPTSSHTDYMPATSSAGVAVAAIIPMGSTSSSNAAESSSQVQESSDAEQVQQQPQQQQQQQVVALVSPRIENAPPQQQLGEQPSASTSSSMSQQPSVAMSSHHQASSSNTVTTSQAGSHKRPRDVEGDSSTGSNDETPEKMGPQKRVRVEGFQGVSESGLDVEYQVPTSSQRDQDDIIVVDSDEDDEGMPDEGNAEADEDPFDNDGNENFEMDAYEQEPEIAGYDEGPDIDDDNVQSANNEVEIDDVPQVPNQSGAQQGQQEAGSTSSSNVVGQSSNATTSSTTNNTQGGEQAVQNQSEAQQQIQSISSGSGNSNDAGPSTSLAPTTSQWRQSPNTSSRQQHASHLMLTSFNDETSDDRIVPSTPTLYVNRRSDG